MYAQDYRVPLNSSIFHTPKVQYSKETHALLKQLIEESTLSIKQRKLLQETVKNGEVLPLSKSVSCNDKILKKGEYLVPPAFQKRRTLDKIVQSGAYEREKFSTTYNIGNSNKEKIRLQSLMAFGKEVPQEYLDVKKYRKTKQKDNEEIDIDETFNYLIEGIRERIEFLKEMEKLGEAKSYSTIIKQEIAHKLHQMEQLSLEKCKELGILDKVKHLKNNII